MCRRRHLPERPLAFRAPLPRRRSWRRTTRISTVKAYQAVDDASADLAAGRVDLVLSDKVLLDAWLKKSSDGTCCELAGPDLIDPAFGAGKGVAVRKENPELRDLFDAAIKTILADGTYKKINDKYFSFSIY
ncbi:transporter substrate-binding domain-containing protein [Mesorhizobium sp. AaZ16]|uniref:transporter substrate-binding domain-containing protein n=1 Tax=Mesorhizobium sp. AaZ16 TaxID=3402289 RepID=UPI00374E6246